jgi:AcrR family transcriptional regulator
MIKHLFKFKRLFNFEEIFIWKAMSVDKREHIINTAIKLFATKGFEGTSIRDLAAAADVNVAMVNYYFGSKEKLFESMVEHNVAYTRGAFDEIFKDNLLSEIEKIDKIIDLYVSRIFSNREFHKVLHHEIQLNQRPELGKAISDVIGKNYQIIKDIIEAGIRKKEFKKVDVQLTIATLTGTFNSLVLSKKVGKLLLCKGSEELPYDDEKFRKRVADHLKQMMRGHLLRNEC